MSKRRTGVSHASWLVLMWTVIFAARPVSMWFSVSGSQQTPDGYMDGNPLERVVFLALIVVGAIVLARRRLSLASVIGRNGWLFAFYAYCALSILWSDYTFVAFKRWFKDFGNVVMVLVLLTEADPVQAVKAVFARCAYLLVTLSVLFIRYMPELGRVYWGWNQSNRMFVGVATHKNTLGALLLVSSLFLFWDLVSRRKAPALETGSPRLTRFGWLDPMLVLLMSVWLLSITDSATSLLCAVLGVIIYLLTGMKAVKSRLRFIEAYVIAGTCIWLLLDSAFKVTELLVLSVGRDMTFTTRTDAWDLVLSQQDNPLFGAGFKSFWSGERLVRLWRDLPGIVQAHSGYVETYLNGGLVGLGFLTAMLLAGFRKIKRQLVTGDDFARIRLTFWVLTLVYNFSEAAFNQLSLLWVVTLLVITDGPQPAAAIAPVAVISPAVRSVMPPRPGRWQPAANDERWRNGVAKPGWRERPKARAAGGRGVS